MRKRGKKLFAIIIALSLSMSGMPVYAAEDTNVISSKDYENVESTENQADTQSLMTTVVNTSQGSLDAENQAGTESSGGGY